MAHARAAGTRGSVSPQRSAGAGCSTTSRATSCVLCAGQSCVCTQSGHRAQTRDDHRVFFVGDGSFASSARGARLSHRARPHELTTRDPARCAAGPDHRHRRARRFTRPRRVAAGGLHVGHVPRPGMQQAPTSGRAQLACQTLRGMSAIVRSRRGRLPQPGGRAARGGAQQPAAGPPEPRRGERSGLSSPSPLTVRMRAWTCD